MSTIKAVVVDPDAPNRLALADVEEPSPTPSEALVRVAAVSLNRGEVRRAESSEPGFRPGWDLAGTVERAAADGSGPQEGSRVVGFLPSGAWAELAAVPTELPGRAARGRVVRGGFDAAGRRPHGPLRAGGGRESAREDRPGYGRLGRSRAIRVAARPRGRGAGGRARAPGGACESCGGGRRPRGRRGRERRGGRGAGSLPPGPRIGRRGGARERALDAGAGRNLRKLRDIGFGRSRIRRQDILPDGRGEALRFYPVPRSAGETGLAMVSIGWRGWSRMEG